MQKESNRRLVKNLDIITRLSEIENFVDMITWADALALNWPVGETFDIIGVDIDGTKLPPAINTKVYEDEILMVFNTIIPPGAAFRPKHCHDYIEVCYIMKGVFSDEIRGKDYLPGEYCAYDVNEYHLPKNQNKETVELIVFWVNTTDHKEAQRIINNYNKKK